MSVRYSIRTLLVVLAVIGAMLGATLRFGPHLFWRLACARIANGVEPIPAKPLVAPPATGDVVIGHVGPLSLELPQPISQTITVGRGQVEFSDGQRRLLFVLPKPDSRSLQNTIRDMPAKSALSFPRLYKEVCDAQSSDFSFGMSNRELRWHQWLLTQRALISIDLRSIEYQWRSELEGHLATVGSAPRVFQWATTDGRWEGTMYFEDATNGNADWVRRACATLTLRGDLVSLWDRDDATIKSLVKITAPDDSRQE